MEPCAMQQRSYVELRAALAQGNFTPRSAAMCWPGVKIGRLGSSTGSGHWGICRDDAGGAQGTVLVEVLEPVSTDSNGHWIKGGTS